MYHNTYLPVMSLDKAPVKSGGLCKIFYFKIEDVKTWPAIDPQTGIMAATIELKEGAVLYFCEAIDQGRSFEEVPQDNLAGPFYDITVKGSLRGSNAANTLSAQKMRAHQWGLIVEDRNVVTRLIGNQDSGADFKENYTSGTISSSRKTDLTWSWQHPITAPIYDAKIFEIIIGGIILHAGCITFIKRFKVGAPGSPMNQGDLLYINDLMKNKRILAIVDGKALPTDDFSGDVDWTGSIDRRIEKAVESNTINFVGSVFTDEIIELYAYTA